MRQDFIQQERYKLILFVMPKASPQMDNTKLSTTADLKTVFYRESKRYTSKGTGLIPALLIVATYFYFAPILCKRYWPVVLSYTIERGWSACQLTVVVTLLWHYLWHFVATMYYYAIYHLEHPFFERDKISKEPWPWQENREEWMKTLKKSFIWVGVNSFIVLPISIVVASAVNNFEIPYAIDAESIPDRGGFVVGIILEVMGEDLILHFVHKWMHHPLVYPYVHKMHHEYIQSVGFAAHYSHPIEYVLISVIPSGLVSLLLGRHLHITTMLMHNLAREFETQDGHCGYEFSWSPFRLMPFSAGGAYHEFHHAFVNCNYSSFLTFWDTLLGHNDEFNRRYLGGKEIEKKEE
ncbi:hypothetical protein FGO68_gene347 [Halteria grandinella]|uniref:Fatty acid hydroxylase domain-containing protein n=1 Tax=Halteria grandinella TaxID=5974 RepID=A0A8J8NNX8_HALGN|nr:hypothetical protein FGO68_gene347 [Halteria grandinella]